MFELEAMAPAGGACRHAACQAHAGAACHLDTICIV